MALKLKQFTIIKTLLIFSLALLLFTGCEVAWFGDIKTDIESDLTSTFRFYAVPQETNPEAQVVELTYGISEEVDSSQFPLEEIDIVKAGYHIDYWHFYRDSNTQSTQIPSSVYMDSLVKDKVSSIKVTPQMFDFYAVWAPNTDTKYTVQHYFQNLTVDGYEIDDNRTQVLTGTTDQNTSAKAYEVTGFIPQKITQVNIDGDETGVVKVYYDRIKSYVTVDQADGNDPVVYEGYFGQKLTEVAPLDRTASGYTFSKWIIELEDGSTEESEETNVVFREQKVIYTAVWKEIIYSITWNTLPQGGNVIPGWSNGYSPVTSYTVSTGCTIPSNNSISRTGAVFEGWYADPEFTTPAASWTSGQLGNKTFYAKWSLIVYTISYTTNGGSAVTTVMSYNVEQNISLPVTAKTGWVFKGWYDNSVCAGTSIPGWSSGTRTGNLALYAKWAERASQIGGVTITYPVENDANLSLSVSFSTITDDWTYSAASGYSTYDWYYDGIKIAGWSSSGTGASVGQTLTPGYHNILLVVKDASGNQYSASADVQVIQ